MDLIQELIKQVGVNEQQAKGGAGLLFKLAQSKLSGGDFASLAKAVPTINDLIKQVPSSSGMGGLLGGLAKSIGGDKLGDLAGMASSLSSLKIDQQTLGKFIPVIVEFVKKQGNPELAALIGKFIPKL
jgi:Protein of unknown function VcgC/VcgE (DUF2780)